MAPHTLMHPTDQTLSDFSLGKLDDKSAESVNQHLEECADCQSRVAGMSGDSFLERLQKVHGSSAVPGNQTAGVAATSQKVAPPPADTLPPGLVDHPDFEIIRELGRGGMGVVYLAKNQLMGRLEVLKVVGGHLVSRPGVLDRFLREIQSAAKLQHKNIVTAYSAIRLGEGIVLSMEYVEGEDLAKQVKSGGPLPVANACYFIYQAALGLQHAHERGMVHRDIKPANLILAREGKKAVVKVLDFGLAKVTSEGQVDSSLTREGQMLGTPDYIAPEQIRDAQKADIRADVYSLGCTFYYLLTGHAPFRCANLYDLYQAHFSMDADPLNLVRPEVPAELASLVAKMLAKEPHRRFQTPGEVAQALTPFFKSATNARPGSSPEISRVGQAQAPAAPVSEQSAVSNSVAPRPAPVAPSKAKAEAVAWESLIEFKETERSKEEVAPLPRVASGPNRRPPWMWSAVAVGVLMFGLLAAWLSGVFKVKTTEGVIVLENVPKDAEILVDGDRITFSWPGVGKPLEIRAVPGQRKVEVKKDEFTTFGEVVTVKTDESVEITVRLEALTAGGTGGLPASAFESPGQSLVDKPSVPSAAVSQTSPELVAFYDFNDGTANDRSGHGNHGVLSANPPTFISEGYQGGALSFDDQKKNVMTLPVDINPSILPQVTIGGWFNANASISMQTLITHDDTGFDRSLKIDNRGGGGYKWSAFKRQGVVGGAPVTPGQWTFVCMRHDQFAGKLTLDVDAVRIKTEAFFGPGHKWTTVGASETKPTRFSAWFRGKMDNLFFYKGLLGDEKIADIRARGQIAILSGSELSGGTSGSPASVVVKAAQSQEGKPPAPPALTERVATGSEKASSTVPPTKGTFDPNATYRFTNNWQRRKSLDIRKDDKNNDHPVVADTGNIPGQQWRIIPLGDGWCRITNDGLSGKSLDITNNDQPVMADTGDLLSQQWSITPGNGWFRITNRRLPGKGLDIINDGKNNRLKIETGSWTGQWWKIIGSEKVSDTAPPTIPILKKADYDSIAAGKWIPVLEREMDLKSQRVDIPGLKAGDVIIRARVKKVSGQHLALALRYDEDHPLTQGYSVWFNGGNWFGIHRWGAGRNDLGQWHAATSFDGFFELAFSAVGDMLTFYADGKRIGEARNPDHRSGSLAIGALRGESLFQNVEIMILDKPAPSGSEKVSNTVPPPGSTRGQAPRYPSDAIEHQGKHYKVYAQRLTWYQAKSKCEQLGGRLAVVKSEEENRLLTALARNAGVEGAWLGATDEKREGQWVWVDGSPMMYNNWDVEVHQPNNKEGLEHYLILLARRDGKWSDQPNELIDKPAQLRPGFVCQWTGSENVSVAVPPVAAPSPSPSPNSKKALTKLKKRFRGATSFNVETGEIRMVYDFWL